MSSRATRYLLVCTLVLTSSLTGCGSDAMTFVDEGRDFELEATADVLAQIEAPELDEEETVARARTDALTALRSEGELAGQAADLITQTFPSDTRAVPFYVERATVDGDAAWLIVEAIGRTGAPLEDERLWVLADDGAVLFSANE